MRTVKYKITSNRYNFPPLGADIVRSSIYMKIYHQMCYVTHYFGVIL
jgi:hypothetical protein